MQAHRSEIAAVDKAGCGRERVIQIRAAVTTDGGATIAMMGRCSSKTLFHRFHGYVDAAGHLKRQRDGSTAIFLAWQGQTCVGMGELANDAHLAVLVADGWQGRGVGTRLLSAVVDEAAVRDFDVLHADILREDAFLLGGLRRIGPLTVSHQIEVLSVDIKIGGPLKRSSSRCLRVS